MGLQGEKTNKSHLSLQNIWTCKLSIKAWDLAEELEFECISYMRLNSTFP